MKAYKDFKNNLMEAEAEPNTHDSSMSLGSGSYSIHQIDKPEALETLNRFLENVTKKAYFNPDQAVVPLRGTLNKLGFDFEIGNPNTGSAGTSDGGDSLPIGEGSYKLNMFGGEFGKALDTPIDKFNSSDVISDKLGHSLSLEINYESVEDGLTKISAKVVPSD